VHPFPKIQLFAPASLCESCALTLKAIAKHTVLKANGGVHHRGNHAEKEIKQATRTTPQTATLSYEVAHTGAKSRKLLPHKKQ
jgi:hypothetical protein